MKQLIKLLNILFVFCVFGFMILGLVRAYIDPVETNETENRLAEKMPIPNVESFLDGSFQNGCEEALSDQGLFSAEMKELYNNISGRIKLKAVDLLKHWGGSGQYIGFNDLIYNDGYLMQPIVMNEGEVAKGLEETLDRIESATANLDVPVYIYYVGRDMDHDFYLGKESGIYERISQRLGESVTAISRFHVENIEEYKQNFYKTDHHYNHEGVHRAYKEVLEMLLPGEEPMERGELLPVNYEFHGSRSRVAGALGLVTEQMYAYVYDLPEVTLTINGKQDDEPYGQRERYLAGALNPNAPLEYSHFYGYDYGWTRFDNSAVQNGERLLILGDSYDNSYLWMLADHFESVHSVDLRNYSKEDHMGKEFSLSDFVKEQGITRVMFAGRNELFYDTLKALEG